MWNILQSILLYSSITIISLMLLLAYYYKRSFNVWKQLGVPHLKPSFPFGNMDSNFSKRLGQTTANIYHEMKKQGHSYCGYYMFAMPVIMPIDPKMNKYFLINNFNAFNDRGFHSDEVNDPMGSSLITWGGEKWRRMRSKLAPLWTPVKIKLFFPYIQKCIGDLVEVIDESIAKGSPINMRNIGRSYTVDVICSCAFGVDGGCLKNPDAEFLKHANMIFTTGFRENIRLAIGQSASGINKLFKIELFNPTATSFFRKVVHETVAYREKHNIERADFINLMIRLKNNKSIEDGEEKSDKKTSDSGITVDLIASQCFLFFIAGFETTAAIMQHLFFELAKNPNIQAKARQDVIDTLKKHNGAFTYEAVHDMKYVENVLNETVRKHPPVHMLTRMSVEDFSIPDTNIKIKKGTRVALSLLGLHRDPEFYPNPEVFDPDRFTDEAKAARPPYTYLPFGDGPRICPGLRFGIAEIRSCVATLLLKYKFTIHPNCQEIKSCSLGTVLGTEEPIILNVDHV